jgi:hypothetical protein
MMETVGNEVRGKVGEELERILASDYFRNSKQAERLLRYLVANSLDEQDDQLRERIIGEKVFGREPKYDSNADSIVRVWANHLRKRLAQYYLAEGQHSALRFDLRPGSYRIEFRQVVLEAIVPTTLEKIVEPEPIAAPEPVARHAPPSDVPRRPPFLLLMSGLAAALAMVCAWLMFQNLQLRNQVREPKVPAPLNLLWSRMLGGRQAAEIVLADSSLSLFQDLLHKSVTLQEYVHHDYLLMAADPSLSMLMTRRYTSTADMDVLRRTLRLAGADTNRLEVTFARDFPPDDLKNRNVILVGSKRSNPWAEPFEAQMNFHFDYSISEGVGVIVNTHPQPGEPAGFSVPRPFSETTESYGLVAFQPNLAHTGNALMIAGLGMQGTLAAGELATSPEIFKQVVDLLGANGRADLPYFEVVLKAGMVGSTVHGFKIVAWRRSQPH